MAVLQAPFPGSFYELVSIHKVNQKLLRLIFLNFKIFLLISRLLIFCLQECLAPAFQANINEKRHLHIFTFITRSLASPLNFCIDSALKENHVDLIDRVNLSHLNNLVLGQIVFMVVNLLKRISNSPFFAHMNQITHFCLNVNLKMIFVLLLNNSVSTWEVKMLIFMKFVWAVTTILNIQDFYKSLRMVLAY